MMKRHETDWTSLIAGVTFCAIAVAYLGSQITDRTLELRWMVPILLIGLGIAGLAGTLVRARRLSGPAPEPVTPTDTADLSDDGPHLASP
jgi:hypothetical protein